MQDQAGPEFSSGAGCLLRTYWLFGGPAALFILLASIFQKAPELLSFQDVGFVLVAASLIAARYVDVRHYKGQTGYGEPATLDHWRSYAVRATVICSGLWLAVRALTHDWQ